MPFTLPQTIWHWLTNPNVVYLFLIIGVWSFIAAWLVPGTGVAEAFAVTCLVLAAIGLFQLPTNIAALLLILVAVGLYLVEAHASSHGVFALLGTVLLVIGSLFLFGTAAEAQRVSRWLIFTVAAVTLGLFWVLMTFGLAAQRRPVEEEARMHVGDVGEARTDLAPRGVVYIGDEEWSAETAGAPITAGTRVKVVAIRGLHLLVEPVQEDTPTELEPPS